MTTVLDFKIDQSTHPSEFYLEFLRVCVCVWEGGGGSESDGVSGVLVYSSGVTDR